jgi:hypothetical protein
MADRASAREADEGTIGIKHDVTIVPGRGVGWSHSVAY